MNYGGKKCINFREMITYYIVWTVPILFQRINLKSYLAWNSGASSRNDMPGWVSITSCIKLLKSSHIMWDLDPLVRTRRNLEASSWQWESRYSYTCKRQYCAVHVIYWLLISNGQLAAMLSPVQWYLWIQRLLSHFSRLFNLKHVERFTAIMLLGTRSFYRALHVKHYPLNII